MNGRGVLIAGGYGIVGRRIAAELSSDCAVIVAGRPHCCCLRTT